MNHSLIELKQSTLKRTTNVSRTSLDPPPGRGTAGQRIHYPVVGDTTPGQRMERDPRRDELARWSRGLV